MGLLREQLIQRRRLDDQELEQALAMLARSAYGDRSRRGGMGFAGRTAHATIDRELERIMEAYDVVIGELPEHGDNVLEYVEAACRPAGVMYRRVRLEGAWYKDASMALLVWDEDDVPHALLPGAFGGYRYRDWETGRDRKFGRHEARRVSPEAVCLYRPLPQRRLTNKDLWAFIGTSLDGIDIAFSVVVSVAVVLLGCVLAPLTQMLFGEVIPLGDECQLLPVVMLMAGASVSWTLMIATRELISTRLVTKASVCLRAAVMARVLCLPTDFFKEYTPGELAARVMSVTSVMRQALASSIAELLGVVFSLGYLIQLVYIAPQLVPASVAVFVLELVVTALSLLADYHYIPIQQRTEAESFGVLSALLGGMQKIKLSGAEKRAFVRWSASYVKHAESMYAVPMWYKVSKSLVPVVGVAGNVPIYLVAGASGMPVATFMAFSTCFGQLLSALTAINQSVGSSTQIFSALLLLEPMLSRVPETSESKRPVSMLSGGIEVSRLAFRYEEDMPYVLDNVSLKIRPGEYVAIVGKTGCGKSTLMRLLLGFERAERGAIYYDGNEISAVDIESLRRHIGTVMQGAQLVRGSIRTNITIGTPQATLEDAWNAAELAGIAEDIRAMPMGMETLIGEGSGGISGGQRQRIAIARAVCSRPRILMFDEATSALDNVTQRHVSESLERLRSTRIVIAHRLSTIENCDRIIMLDEGHIVEEGRYDELVARDGKFAQLVKRQRFEEGQHQDGCRRRGRELGAPHAERLCGTLGGNALTGD